MLVESRTSNGFQLKLPAISLLIAHRQWTVKIFVSVFGPSIKFFLYDFISNNWMLGGGFKVLFRSNQRHWRDITCMIWSTCGETLICRVWVWCVLTGPGPGEGEHHPSIKSIRNCGLGCLRQGYIPPGHHQTPSHLILDIIMSPNTLIRSKHHNGVYTKL